MRAAARRIRSRKPGVGGRPRRGRGDRGAGRGTDIRFTDWSVPEWLAGRAVSRRPSRARWRALPREPGAPPLPAGMQRRRIMQGCTEIAETPDASTAAPRSSSGRACAGAGRLSDGHDWLSARPDPVGAVRRGRHARGPRASRELRALPVASPSARPRPEGPRGCSPPPAAEALAHGSAGLRWAAAAALVMAGLGLAWVRGGPAEDRSLPARAADMPVLRALSSALFADSVVESALVAMPPAALDVMAAALAEAVT